MIFDLDSRRRSTVKWLLTIPPQEIEENGSKMAQSVQTMREQGQTDAQIIDFAVIAFKKELDEYIAWLDEGASGQKLEPAGV